MAVAIVAGAAPSYAGGLASYQCLLANLLEDVAGIQTKFLAERTEPNLSGCGTGRRPVAVFGGFGRPFSQFCRSLAARPGLHFALETILGRVCRSWFIDTFPAKTRVVHFVGTGWDLIGFPAAQAAVSIGARFTVWPAVHPASWGDDRIDLRLYNRADAIFCQSDFEARHLIEKGLKPEKVVRCGLPPMCREDGSARRFRQKYELGNRPTVLFLGRRDRGKGYPALLHAWRNVLASLPEAVLLVAGPGGDEFAPLIEALPTHSYRDLGVADEMLKADALAACDVFCLPSAHESFGIVYVEAWSYGKPVVCGTAPACRELIEDGQTGIWANQHSCELAERLAYLLARPSFCIELGQNGFARQRQEFMAERCLSTHLKGFGIQ